MKFEKVKNNIKIFLAKISQKISKKKIIKSLQIRLFMFSFTIFTLPFLVNLPKIEQNSIFPVAESRQPLKKIWVVATAYSSDVGQTDDTPCIPADGYDLCEHYEKFGEGNTIAANFLPLGAQVKIPELYGDKIFVVHDRMNSRYGYGRVDIWMPSTDEAKNFGVKRLEMELYGGNRWKISYK